MSTRRKCIVVFAALSLFGFVLAGQGCKKSGAAEAADAVELCTACGQIKGGDLCCKPGQAKCESCSLVKGSPGCCKIPKGAATAAICTKCGQIKGGDLCCKPDQTRCPKCGLVQGSPGCCKIPKESWSSEPLRAKLDDCGWR